MGISPVSFIGDLYKDYIDMTITAAETLPARNTCARLQLSAANFTITMPNPLEAKGKIFSLLLTAIGTSYAVTLQDNADSEDWTGDFTLDAVNDHIILWSDGRKWCVLLNEIA